MIICVALIRLNKENLLSNSELLLYSLGLGPMFTVLLLYYLLLIFPHHSNLFYFSSVLIIYLILSLLGRKNFSILGKDIIKRAKNTKKLLKKLDAFHRTEFTIFSLVLILFLASFLFLYLKNTQQVPLDETDALKYGVIGKAFFEKKSLNPRWIRPDPETGFYFDATSAPSFSLFLTWEKIIDSFFNVDKDFYYKSTSAYYALLILSVLLFWLSKKSKYLALLAVFALLSGFSFFSTLIQQHLDSFRVFFLIISWIFLAHTIHKKDLLSFLFLGIFSGFAAFAHTSGATIAIFNCLTLFIFMEGNFKNRLSRTNFMIIIVIIFGWFHYILDIFWGFGWIFFQRIATWWG